LSGFLMEIHAPLDMDGNDLRIGDWVRVVAVPLSIKGMPDESKEAFSNAVGNTFQILAFDETGCLHLEMWPKVSMDTIWLEPFLAKRSRRYKRLSRSFQNQLALYSAPPPPRFELKFDIRLKEGIDIDQFGGTLIDHGSGGGFACWPEDRRIKGSVYANRSDPNAIETLRNVRRIIGESEHISSYELGEIAEFKDPNDR